MLATNVAETSLTVPGIRYVVDTGVARISRYSARTKVQRLPIEPISQASANQRSGRCGRVEAGIAIRLYSEEDFEARPEFTDPEILRTNLASVILQMTSLGLGDIARFPFVEPPDKRNVGRRRPAARGAAALEPAGRARPSGSPTRLRLDQRPAAEGPRLTKMGGGWPAADRPAAGADDPRGRAARLRARRDRDRGGAVPAGPARAPGRAAGAGRPAARPVQGRRLRLPDLAQPVALPQEQQRELSRSAFRRMCKREFLNYLRVREWQDFESQLRQVCKEMADPDRAGRPTGTEPDADGIHQALLSGLLSHIGVLEELEEPDRKASAARGSTSAPAAPVRDLPRQRAARKNPQFLMAGELVETGRLWARQNAAIKPEWAERLGAHLVKRTYSEPHWSKKRAAVMAYERVTLYGVPLVADRLVKYGKIDPALARELFIRHALVYGEWHTRHRFYRDNLRLLEEAEELEHRARRRDIVVDEHTLFDFYDARVGAEVVSGAHFDQWWKQERREQPDLLTFDPAMLTHDTAEEIREADYPERWVSGRGADLPDQLPLRAGRRRRRAHHRRPGRRRSTGSTPTTSRGTCPACARSWSPA